MTSIVTFLAIFLFFNSLKVAEAADKTDGTIWAVLVAGSNGWWNYRHQADICHAWHVLVDHGVPPGQIITMMYDDIAHNKLNPYPGKLFNSPLMRDVYEGVRIDYRGDEVTPANLKAVLLGNEGAVDGKRVLKSTDKDKVFVYFSDHGAFGLIAFPYVRHQENILTVKDLTQTLQRMHAKRMYDELTFYLEACESGSMFDQKTAQQINVFAATASNAFESSWGCYCDTNITGLEYTCLGDLFSVNWMEDSDKRLFLRDETIGEQFNLVKRLTEFSHVKWFGNVRMMTANLSEFQGHLGSNRRVGAADAEKRLSPRNFKMFPSREIPFWTANSEKRKFELLEKRAFVDAQMERIERVLGRMLPQNASNGRPSPADQQGITQLECHHQVMHTFNKFCFNFSKSPYVLKYAKRLANLCEQRLLDTAQIISDGSGGGGGGTESGRKSDALRIRKSPSEEAEGMSAESGGGRCAKAKPKKRNRRREQPKGQQLCPPLSLEAMKNKYIVIRDEHSKLFGHRFLNSQLSLYLGSVQLLFCLWALTQHIWSMASLNKILYCDFSPNSTLPPLFTHVDAIIFDIGLFHNLWGISGCVAQHLDGGYGRFCWCIAHSAALLFCLPLAFVSRPKPNWLWPLLIQQSAYGVGMLILSLAALPRAAHFLGDLSNAPVKAIVFYSLGTLMNFFLLYVYWHWYWHVETLWNSARKLRRGETFTGSTTKRPIRRCSPVGGGRAPLLEVTTAGGVPIRNGAIGEGTGRMPKPTGRLPNECAVKGGGTEEHKGKIGSAEAAGHLLIVGVENARNARAVQTGAGGGHLDNNHAKVARSPDDVLGGERLQKRRRKSPSLLEGMDSGNSPNSFHSLGSTTASSIASTTTSSTTTQQKPIRKPPPPAPSPAVDASDQEKCRSHFPNHHRTTCLNELTLSPRKHLPQLHHQNHSQKRSSGRLSFSSSVKEGQILSPKRRNSRRRSIRQRNLLLGPRWRAERGIDQRSLGFGVGNGLIDLRKTETLNWRSKLWTGTTESGTGHRREGQFGPNSIEWVDAIDASVQPEKNIGKQHNNMLEQY
uniref:legumain n=1 Tax=Globodera rostochiensis TaxID=31243 RepID=A0A914HNS0_GLORO